MRVGFGFSSVTFQSRVFHSRVFSQPSVDTDEQSRPILEVSRIFTNHSKRCDKFFVLTMSLYTLLFRYFISSYYVHAVENSHCTIRFINRIFKEVLDETFSISCLFHKIVPENSLL